MMRLTDIHEQLESSNVTQEEFRNLLFNTVFNVKSYNIPVTNGNVTLTIGRSNILETGQIEIGVAYYPIETTCPSTMFKEPMEYFLTELLGMIKNTVQKTDPSILSGININYYGFAMYYKEGLINFTSSRDFLNRSDKAAIMSDINLNDAITNMDMALYDLIIPEDRLPKFDPTYGEMMDRAIKKMKSIWVAFRKGTYKGNTYEFQSKPSFYVHQESEGWNPDSRVLRPTFWLKINTYGYPTLSNNNDDLTLKAELLEYLKKKVATFDIELA
jgi:hypothetical protein